MHYPRFLARAIVAAGLAAATPMADAQTRTPCAERDAVVQRLKDKYGETLQSMGLHQSNAVMEVYASESTGTWTILVTRPDGMACLIAAGQMWEGQAASLTPPGDEV